MDLLLGVAIQQQMIGDLRSESMKLSSNLPSRDHTTARHPPPDAPLDYRFNRIQLLSRSRAVRTLTPPAGGFCPRPPKIKTSRAFASDCASSLSPNHSHPLFKYSPTSPQFIASLSVHPQPVPPVSRENLEGTMKGNQNSPPPPPGDASGPN